VRRYAVERAEPVELDFRALRAMGVKPVCADLLLEDHLIRHDPRTLAQLLLGLAALR
jgi:hypothetical protein